MNVSSPLALALRAIQKYDEVAGFTPKLGADPLAEIEARVLLIEAETILGNLLGLECTGEPTAWSLDDGRVTGYSHNGDTCPIHEWLVPADQKTAFQIVKP